MFDIAIVAAVMLMFIVLAIFYAKRAAPEEPPRRRMGDFDGEMLELRTLSQATQPTAATAREVAMDYMIANIELMMDVEARLPDTYHEAPTWRAAYAIAKRCANVLEGRAPDYSP